MGAITTAVSAISSIGSLVGTGIQTVGAIAGSQAQANVSAMQGDEEKRVAYARAAEERRLAKAQADAIKAEALMARRVAASEQAQLNQRAGQERASSQLGAIEAQRQARLAQSKARAIAAASGAGTGGSAKTVLNRLAADGNWNAAVALYEGEEAARGLEYQGKLTRAQGRFAGEQGAASAENVLAAGEANAVNLINSGNYASAAGNYAAKSLRQSGYMSAAGSLISGAASFYSKYWPTDETSTMEGSYGLQPLTGGPGRTRYNYG